LFESNKIEGFETLSNRKWNHPKQCFKISGGSYNLYIKAGSACKIENNQAFIAIDNISIREISDPNLDSSCSDIEITKFPELETQEDSTFWTETIATDDEIKTTYQVSLI